MSGDLKWNKIFGAGLATALAIVGVQQVTSALYASEPPEKMGYFIDAPEEAAGGAEEELPPDWGTVLPVADLAAGEAAFARCQACHTINQGGANGIGPNLYGVVGGPVMHAAGFAYSDAFQAHRGEAPTWTYDELDAFITAPQRHISGTKMSFAGIRDTETRVNLIAYLRAQGSTGYAIPAPDPSRQPGAAPAEGEVPAEGAAEGAAVEAGAPTTGTGPQAPVAGPGAAPTLEQDVAPPASDSAPRGG
ncbi:c-type cytochrome [Brevundimonas balnearis]|uniref:C-type cytochrome n=1 Tax=Brevundimonas balnearis TaxID=1572858 RepID=A0ABV6R2S6_9CAUL